MKRAVLPPSILAVWMVASLASAHPPTVVELFTAQGCGSCGKANAYLARLADRPGVIALTFNVDYWDYLGWKDTFAHPEFADRQRAYDKRLGERDVYTPQVIVGGAAQASGDKSADVDALIDQAKARAPAKGARPADPLVFTPRADGTIAIGPGRRVHAGARAAAADVWLVRYDPRQTDVHVRNGDNRGRTLAHRDVVRQLARLGAWRGHMAVFKLPAAPEDGLLGVVLVQAAKGGKILAAARL